MSERKGNGKIGVGESEREKESICVTLFFPFHRGHSQPLSVTQLGCLPSFPTLPLFIRPFIELKEGFVFMRLF